MHDYPEAYTQDNLMEILNVNSSCPDFAEDEVRRLVDLAERRAQSRAESAFDDGDIDCIIATNWTGFASGEFGYDNGDINQVAFGVYEDEASAGKDATLFSETVVVQRGWLTSGDGRRSKIEQYEDDGWDDAKPGKFWVPNGAQEYICIVALSNELTHGSPDLSEAM